MKKAALHNLGCKVNGYETEAMQEMLEHAGYVIDAKSIMGIFSLDLSKPIDLNIHADSNLDDILAALDSYIIK